MQFYDFDSKNCETINYTNMPSFAIKYTPSCYAYEEPDINWLSERSVFIGKTRALCDSFVTPLT